MRQPRPRRLSRDWCEPWTEQWLGDRVVDARLLARLLARLRASRSARSPRSSASCTAPGSASDRELAQTVGELLTAFLHPLRAVHSFGKGMGLAAPQIGVTRRAAVVQAPDQPPIVLFNPRILHASEETDEQYEGCLSFSTSAVPSNGPCESTSNMDFALGYSLARVDMRVSNASCVGQRTELLRLEQRRSVVVFELPVQLS